MKIKEENKRGSFCIYCLILIVILSIFYFAFFYRSKSKILQKKTSLNLLKKEAIDFHPQGEPRKKSKEFLIFDNKNEARVGNAYYEAHIQLSDFSSQKAEKEIKDFIEKRIKEFAREAAQDNEPGSEFFVKWISEVGLEHYDNPKIDSYVLEIYEYTGGAHGDQLYKVFNYDKKTGKLLSLLDILRDESVLEQLSKLGKEKFVKKGIDADPSGLLPKPANWELWYLDENNIVFIFPPYSIGPYALGEQRLQFSLEKYPKLFREDFFTREAKQVSEKQNEKKV